MSYTDAVSRISQIQAQIASLQTAFDPAAASTQPSSAVASAGTSTGSGSFADALAAAQQTSGVAGGAQDVANIVSSQALGSSQSLAASQGLAPGTGGAALPAKAQGMLTTAQQQFASRLAADTNLDPNVVSAWLLAEESGGAAQSRQAQNNNDWLNIGYTDSATYGSSDSIWSNPLTAADATAGWLKGQNTIPGYGTASSGIQAILSTAGSSPSAQIAALQQSGWASSGYPDLPSLYNQLAG